MKMNAPAQALQDLEEMLACGRFQSRARFIQNQQRRFGHQGASDLQPRQPMKANGHVLKAVAARVNCG
jgi:hypothetical protein